MAERHMEIVEMQGLAVQLAGILACVTAAADRMQGVPQPLLGATWAAARLADELRQRMDKIAA